MAAPRFRWPVAKSALMTADLIAVVATMALAYQLRGILFQAQEASQEQSRHIVVGALSLPIWMVMFVHYQLYRANRIASRREEFGRLVHAVGASVAAMGLVAFTAKLYVARGWLVFTFVVGVLVLVAEREVVRRLLSDLRRRGHLSRRILIAGANADGLTLARLFASDPALGYDVVGFVDDDPSTVNDIDGCPLLGPVARTCELAAAAGAGGVMVITTAVGTVSANRLARQLPEAGLRVEVVSALCDIAVGRLSLRSLGRFPVLHVEPVRMHGWRAGAKRAFDILVAGTGLVLATPVLAVSAVAIRLTSKGPVIFRQERIGRQGGTFEVLKLRSMVVDADERLAELLEHNDADGPLFKLRRDPRVTAVGRILRRLSLDELPQMWNVLRGEMAIVGPRPALPAETTGWSPELHERLRVRPGITGMWQVSGRSHTTFEEYARLDLYYVDNWSLLVDITIIARTIPAVFRRGAY